MVNTDSISRRLSITDLRKRKGREKIVCLTAYTAPMARILDTEVDCLLVGDSLGMTIYGLPNTLGVDLDMMIRHAHAVVTHSKHACVVVDMPFGSYQESPRQAFRNARRLLVESGAQAVKLEGGMEMVETIVFLTTRGIPVMAHIGLMPQHVAAQGGYRVQGKTQASQDDLVTAAKALEESGAFAMVLEGMAEPAARAVTQAVTIPTIGIGASPACDGQVLVLDDVLGLTPNPPRFAKAYASLSETIRQATNQYAQEVKDGSFPTADHCYKADTSR